MKKIFLLLAGLIIISAATTAQQVEREKVILEIVTGTWCPYCPGAAMGADDLIANGHDVGVIEYHGGDDYENAASSARISYYGVTSYPTAIFDGVLEYGGGSSSQSLYDIYLPRYQQRKAIQSSFSIDISGATSGYTDFEVEIRVDKLASAATDSPRLHFVITESEIAESWQGQSELNFVERMMLPSATGTTLDFSSQNQEIINYSFELEDDWNYEHCELVVFLQNPVGKEILQGATLHLNEFEAGYTYDASLREVLNVADETCSGMISPIVVLRNHASDNLTSADIMVKVNEEETATYQWSGNLAFMESEQITLADYEFIIMDENQLKIWSENPNGNPDEFPKNDTIFKTIGMAPMAVSDIYLNLRLDNKPEETHYELIDQDGQVLYSEGPFPGQASAFLKDTFELTGGCYTFKIYDDGGDGICCDNGFGFYALNDANGMSLQQGGEFTSMQMVQFSTQYVGIGVNNISTFSVYPNPASEFLNVSLEAENTANVEISLFSITGDKVYYQNHGILSSGSQLLQVPLNGLGKGLYFLEVNFGEARFTEKITVLD